MRRRAEFRRHGLADTAERREHAQEGERAAVDDFLPIDVNGQLPVVALGENDINAQFLTQVRRRTGGLNPGDSVAATSNRHGHDNLLEVEDHAKAQPATTPVGA